MTLTRCKRRWVRLLLLIGVFVPLLTGDITRTYGLLVAIGPNGPLEWITSNVGLGSPHLLGTPVGDRHRHRPDSPARGRRRAAARSAADRSRTRFGGNDPRCITADSLPADHPSPVAHRNRGCSRHLVRLDHGRVRRSRHPWPRLHELRVELPPRSLSGLGNPPQGAAIGIILLVIVSVGTALILTLGRARRRRSTMRRLRVTGLVTACALIPLLIPTILVLTASLSTGEVLTFPPRGFTTHWYAEMIANDAVWTALGNSLYVAWTVSPST